MDIANSQKNDKEKALIEQFITELTNIENCLQFLIDKANERREAARSSELDQEESKGAPVLKLTDSDHLTKLSNDPSLMLRESKSIDLLTPPMIKIDNFGETSNYAKEIVSSPINVDLSAQFGNKLNQEPSKAK